MTRLDRLRAELQRRKIAALLVTRPLHVMYLSGAGDCAWALVTPRGAWLLPYGLGADAARHDAQPGWSVLLPPAAGGGWKALAALLGRIRLRALSFEGDDLASSSADRLRAAVRAHAVIRPAAGIVEGLRLVKDAGEIAAIRRAAAITREVSRQIPWMLATGITEREAGARVDIRMKQLGADGPAFETILLFGERSALPHGHPGARRLKSGDLVLADFGAKLAGYHSDCTRVWVWKKSSPWQRTAYARVAASYAAGRNLVRPGRRAGEPDIAARRALGPLARKFIHSLGHGVGLEIHEGPRLWKTEREKFKTGMVVTVEPGVYLPGRGGIRLEDTVVVRSGAAESLTGSPAAVLPVVGV